MTTSLLNRRQDNDAIMLRELEDSPLLLNFEALQSYSAKPDCFKAAVSNLRPQCEDLQISEQLRIDAAITMTICEIATARHHSVPLECAAYAKESIHAATIPDSQNRGDCVDAFSRSAQFWSSYSGYLREVPQLCHAFRKWHDVDVAKEIYHNITLEKISLIRYLSKKEKATERQLSELVIHSKDLQELTRGMEVLSEKQQLATNQVLAQAREEMAEIIGYIRDSADRTLEEQRRSDSAYRASMELAVERSLERHSEGLTKAAASFSFLLDFQLEASLGNLNIHLNQFGRDAADTRRQWREIEGNFGVLQNNIAALSSVAQHVTQDLTSLVGGVHDLQGLHAEVSQSSFDILSTFSRVTDSANRHLEVLNHSTSEIQSRILAQHHLDSWPWKNIAQKFAGVIIQDSSLLSGLEHVAWFRLLVAFLGGAWNVVYTTSSLILSLGVVMLLTTRDMCLKRLINSRSSCIRSIAEEPEEGRQSDATSVKAGRSIRYRVSRVPDRICRKRDY